MKKLFLMVALALGITAAKAQVVSVQGGNLTYKGKNYGFSQLEVSGRITKNIDAVGTYSKVLAGYDVSTVGFRHSVSKNNVGLSLSGAYIQNHTFEPMFGVDVRISEQVRLAFSSTFSNKMRFIGLKVPIYHVSKK